MQHLPLQARVIIVGQYLARRTMAPAALIYRDHREGGCQRHVPWNLGV